MTTEVERSGGKWWNWFRLAMWSGAVFLLVLPAVAMRFTTEVNWDAFDFAFAAVLLFGSAGLIELASRVRSSFFYRAGIVIAVGVAFMTIWANAAVGMIGSEDNAYNLWFIGVVGLALVGAIAARFRPSGMALALAAAAIAQSVVALIGMTADLRGGVFSLAFALLWLLAAAFFRKAAQGARQAL